MAKFTAGVDIKLKDITWATNGVIPAGTTVRIPDEFVSDFGANVAPTIPGFAWVSQDESTAVPTLPIAQVDVSGLTASLAGKYDKTGGAISGAVTATGAVSGSSLSATGAINGASMSVSGAVNASAVTATGGIVGANITATSRATVGAVTLNGGGFSNAYDTDVWIAGANRTAATGPTQGYYGQHRITGDAGASVHDALAAEIRLNGISNATFLNAMEASVAITGGAVTIPDTRALTGNITVSSGVTGTITSAKVLVAQPIINASTATLTTAYGIYAEQQTAGATNWSVYAPGGNSLFGQIRVSQSTASPADIQLHTNESLRWIIRKNTTAESGSNAGSDLEIIARSDAGGAVATSMTFIRSSGGVRHENVPLGFFATTPQTKKTVTGAKGSNAALGSLLTALAAYGLITDSSSA